MFFLQKNDLNIEKIKVKFSQIFLTLIPTLKEENKIVLTKMAPGMTTPTDLSLVDILT